jgi:mono/diheme cytochrome c family protein
MPSFKNILTGPEIHLVAAYVWSLTNSSKAPAPAAPAPAK